MLVYAVCLWKHIILLDSGTFLIFAGIQLHGCVFGALLRPLEIERTSKAKRGTGKKRAYTTFDAVNTAYVDDENSSAQIISVSNVQYQVQHRRGSLHSLTETVNSTKKFEDFRKKYGFSLFKNYVFLLFTFGILLVCFGWSVDFLFIPTVAVHHGYTAQQGAFLISILGE